MRTIVLGIGNPLLTDDGVGIEVARRVRARLAGRADVVVEEACAGGLAVAERLVGYDRAVLVDAVEPETKPGTVRVLRPEHKTKGSWNTVGAHDASLPVSLKFLQELGERIPEQVVIVGIEAHDLCSFAERLSPAVERAVPEAVARVVELVGAGGGAP
ncbi:MAG TPA: hydrogenase maturation protease [Myxococcales bacterium]|jgi:hydrogenase maturation protease